MMHFQTPSHTKQVTVAIATIFTMGVLTTLGIVIGLFFGLIIGLDWLFTLALESLVELSGHISTIWSHADAFTQLLLLCVLFYIVGRLAAPAVRSLRSSLSK